uniref:Uncharacterized protein n=1 Tax=viral metagenome TaxID=1070528 RepID=A0A6C0JTW0_9ZZZZ
MRSKKRRHTNRRHTRKHKKRTDKNKKIGGAKSSYDDYDYLEDTYRLLVEQARPKPNMGDYYNSFRAQHLYLYGYDDFVGENKLIPIKDYVGFNGIRSIVRGVLERPPPNMPIYYYMSEIVYRNNIITENYWGHSMPHGTQARGGETGFRQIGIRGYVGEEDTIIAEPASGQGRKIKPHSESGIPPYPKWPRGYNEPPDLTSISSIPYIDKFLYFPVQGYKFVVIKPSRDSNIYDTELGEIMLNEPKGEHWFDSEQVCIVFDEFFIPPPLESQEDMFDTRFVADEMLKRNE